MTDTESYYDAPVVIENSGPNGWADPINISKTELEKRKIWKNNKLITLKEANIIFDNNGKPITPIETGKKGRWLLGKFGPNHACDSIVTRFNIYKFRVEFISVKRKDCDKWAIPGGMVDAGEKISEALKRELTEEALSENLEYLINKIINSDNNILYAGPTYGDPRTTNNAWIETYVVNYHISYSLSKLIKLTTQPSENTKVAWISCNANNLYGDHSYFIKLAKNNILKKIIKNLLYTIILLNLLIIIFIMLIINLSKNNNILEEL